MAFRHACFISYRHGQHELKQRFVSALADALSSELELLRSEGVFVDYDRMSAGTMFNESVLTALHESTCMVMIYQPNYFDLRNTFCALEYRTMQAIERHRLSLLRGVGHSSGLIIPVVLRGFETLPPEIKSRRHCEDFSTFLLHEEQISRHPRYAERIRKMAQYIHERCNEYQQMKEAFKPLKRIPDPNDPELVKWIQETAAPVPILPGR